MKQGDFVIIKKWVNNENDRSYFDEILEVKHCEGEITILTASNSKIFDQDKPILIRNNEVVFEVLSAKAIVTYLNQAGIVDTKTKVIKNLEEKLNAIDKELCEKNKILAEIGKLLK